MASSPIVPIPTDSGPAPPSGTAGAVALAPPILGPHDAQLVFSAQFPWSPPETGGMGMGFGMMGMGAGTDLVLRSCDGVCYGLHGAYLSCQSLVWRDMISMPQPQPPPYPPPVSQHPLPPVPGPPLHAPSPGQVPDPIDLTEPAHLLDVLFLYLYPRPRPDLDTLSTGAMLELFACADKYDVLTLQILCEKELVARLRGGGETFYDSVAVYSMAYALRKKDLQRAAADSAARTAKGTAGRYYEMIQARPPELEGLNAQAVEHLFFYLEIRVASLIRALSESRVHSSSNQEYTHHSPDSGIVSGPRLACSRYEMLFYAGFSLQTRIVPDSDISQMLQESGDKSKATLRAKGLKMGCPCMERWEESIRRARVNMGRMVPMITLV